MLSFDVSRGGNEFFRGEKPFFRAKKEKKSLLTHFFLDKRHLLVTRS
jgi:hypothetical protein